MKKILNWLQKTRRYESDVSKEKLFAQGSICIQNGELKQAEEIYRKACFLFSEDADAIAGLAYVLIQQGAVQDAADILNKGIAIHPKHTEIIFLLGQVYMQQKNWSGARSAWICLLEISPHFEYVYIPLLQVCVYSGDWTTAEKIAHQGAFLFPQNSDILLAYATVLVNCEKRNDALQIYRRAYALSPDKAEIVGGLAECCRAIGLVEESIDLHERAIELAPNHPQLFSNYLYALMYGVSGDRDKTFEAHLEFSRRFEVPLISQHKPFVNLTLKGRRLRVGYVSGDFRNHSLAPFIEPVFREHDRQRVEVFAYYTCPFKDEITQRLRSLADHWRDCALLSDEEMANRIRLDGIDVLIDLSGHTGFNRLLVFARKPAPVQMTWLGYQSTTGLSSIDYRITDEALDPVGTSEKYHSEQLLHLPLSGVFFPLVELPQLEEKKSEVFTFGCLNNPSKITDSVLVAWAEILRRAPCSRLLIGNSDVNVEQRIRALLQSLGVESNRLHFVPRMELSGYLELHQHIDLMLDTFPYNGGTTTFYAAFMGVSVLVLAGDMAVSNVGFGVMEGIGLPEMCANNLDVYIDKAVAFANNVEFLAPRQKVRACMLDFYEKQKKLLCRSLEEAFIQKLQRYEPSAYR